MIIGKWCLNIPRRTARTSRYYSEVATMVEQTVGLGTMLIMFGGVPDWIDVDRQGQFMFVGAYNNINLN